VPALQRHFNYAATHLERYMVARYDAGAGYFKPHRDSVTAAYAHRKFALTINLNDDYVGGELTFAEFGNQAFHTPRGTAILFSGALLHEVTPVEQGTRFAFLSFLFDGAANKGLEAQHPEWPKGTAGDLSEPR
jgi:predicted 2-oxoglutarate/Fe(II)-dependent dioxygenase YbiX